MYICVVPVRIYVNVDYVPQIYYDSLTKINTPCFWLSILLPKWRIEINKLLTCSSVFKAAKSTTKISAIYTLLVHSKSTQSLLMPESLVMVFTEEQSVWYDKYSSKNSKDNTAQNLRNLRTYVLIPNYSIITNANLNNNIKMKITRMKGI